MENRRSAGYHIIPEAIDSFSKEEQLSVFEKMAEARAFEECIVKASASGKFKIKIHMSSGQEAVSAAVAVSAWNYRIFTQHRSMDLYIALGGEIAALRDEIMCLDSGCCGGKIGGAFQYFGEGRHMFAHTGFIGENISVGVGYALGSGEKTLCYFGDGAAEEDYALSAFGFASTHKLPVLFVCTDNELSVLSPKEKRRSWELTDVAKGFGLETIDIADDPFSLMLYLKKFDAKLPALINCRVCRNYWHAGVGVDGPPEWNRFHIITEQLHERGLQNEIKAIQMRAAKKMEDVWKRYL